VLNSLIVGQKKVFKAQLRSENSIEALLKTLLGKEVLSTAILLFTEEEEKRPETKPSTALFIFQNLPYACYRLKKDSLEALCFSDYFRMFSQTSGLLSLYPVSPVLFKSLLVMGESYAVIRATSDVIDKTGLIARIEQDKKECVLTLKKAEQTVLYYFREGKLRDSYFEHSEKEESPENRMKNLLFRIDPSRESASELALYEASSISGAEGREKAREQIAAAVPVQGSVWILAETRGEEAYAEWGVEFLNGNKAGFTVQITQHHSSLGRGKMDLRLDDPQVSRHHADLEQSQGVLTLIDNKSTNGLFVNDEKINKKSLIKDDIIRLGDTFLKVLQRSFVSQAGAFRA